MTTRPELALDRILKAFEAELIDASEEEIASALKDLGMTMTMKGSAALVDVRYPGIRRWLTTLYGEALAKPEADEEERAPSPADAPAAPRQFRDT